MRVLVTGAAGFIGSHLTDLLLARGDAVVGVDNLSGGRRVNLETALRCERFKLLLSSVTASLRRLRGERFDTVFHLAAHVGARTVRQQRYVLLVDSVSSAFAALRVARDAGAPLVLVSSSEVYGARAQTPFAEDDFCVVGPPSISRWSYAVAKLWAEQLAVAAHAEHGVRVVVPRLFNVAGSRQRADTGMVVPGFARAALSGADLRVHGDGSQRRCFAHVADIVRVLAALPSATSLFGSVVNVGATSPISVREIAVDVASHVWQRYGLQSRIVEVPHEPQDATAQMPARVPDTARLQRETGMSVPSRWPEIVADVCGYWAQILGVRARKGNNLVD